MYDCGLIIKCIICRDKRHSLCNWITISGHAEYFPGGMSQSDEHCDAQ